MIADFAFQEQYPIYNMIKLRTKLISKLLTDHKRHRAIVVTELLQYTESELYFKKSDK